jgi:hypothetical protein
MGRAGRVNVKRKEVAIKSNQSRAINQALLRKHTSVLGKQK